MKMQPDPTNHEGKSVSADQNALDPRQLLSALLAVKKGDFSVRLPVDWAGVNGKIADTFNDVVAMNERLVDEFRRVRQAVGREGKISQRVTMADMSGGWAAKAESINVLIGDLVWPTKEMARVIGSVAKGDLTQSVALELEGNPLQGEFLRIARTVNTMVEQLSGFTSEVTRVAREVGVEGKLGGQANVPGTAGTWKDLTDNVNLLAANLTTQVRAIADVATAVTNGDLSQSVQVETRGEVAELKDNINEMIRNLRDTTQRNTEQDWLKTNLTKFTRMLQGQRDLVSVARALLSELAPLVSAQYARFYLVSFESTQVQNDRQMTKLLATYEGREADSPEHDWVVGQGLVRQCAIEKKSALLNNVPPDYIQISSGLGQASPFNIMVLPVIFEGQAKAVLELASFERFSPTHQDFFEQLTESVGIVLNTIEANMRTEGLLKQSLTLAKELQSQQQELKQTNEELAKKARLLSEQNAEVERKNQEIEQARGALEEKAAQLALTSKYKSEFLANMSHELRTPLNSLLILSQQLAENPVGNLTAKQVEFAETIHGSGTDLLHLINDILDLSKIESGTVTIKPDEVSFTTLRYYVESNFRHVAEKSDLQFPVHLTAGLPATIITDTKRLQQVLKNLLSNAFKFTEKGRVEMTMAVAASGWSPDHPVLNRARMVVAFSVADTGMGIHPDKQKIIFEAFQQADAGTARKQGGTGLGLAISRELASLLGGEIQLTSEPGRGSTFTLYLPQTYMGASTQTVAAGPSQEPEKETSAPAYPPPQLSTTLVGEVSDDRNEICAGDAVILLVENDPKFARILLQMARDKGFKGVVAPKGASALAFVHEYKPIAITLDIVLPDMDGWTVLDRLKIHPDTCHIPVYIISAEADRQQVMNARALASLAKPVSRESLEAAFVRIQDYVGPRAKQLLVVEADEVQRNSIVELIGDDNLNTIAVGTGAEAIVALRTHSFHCMVLDLKLPDMTGFQLLEGIEREPELRDLPIIIYTGRGLSNEETGSLAKVARSIIIKEVLSPERLLHETTLFLHRSIANLPAPKREMLERFYQSDKPLAGKQVLIVDDDIRNIFCLTSLLERHDVLVHSAATGKNAIEILQSRPGVDLILMDIMMPEIDGYDTMRAIREIPGMKSLPIIALTAKAMKGDREKCLQAGASDYIAKPVNTEQLVALLRVWLHRKFVRRANVYY